MNSYTQIPNAVFQGMACGELSRDEFEVLVAGYFWADRQAWVIRSYSAARLCRFLGLDANEGNVRRFERAARSLLDRKIIQRDYHRGMERTYSLWVPSPKRFQRVGTPEENEVSLWGANVGVHVGDNVGVPDYGTPIATGGYSDSEPDNVVVCVGESGYMMSITNQESQNPEREIPLNPPTGGLLPSAPQGERSGDAGLSKTVHKGKPLTVEQCRGLRETVILYANFTHDKWGFVPNIAHLESLLRRFTPLEILRIQVSKWNPGLGALRYNNREFAHFFAVGAKTLMEAARLSTKDTQSYFDGSDEQVIAQMTKTQIAQMTKQPMWKAITDAYEKVFGVVNENAGAKS